MRRWFVQVGNEGTEYQCNLVRAFPMSKTLQLEFDGKEFFIKFHSQDDYQQAKNCIKSEVFIANKSRTKHRIGYAVFKPITKK